MPAQDTVNDQCAPVKPTHWRDSRRLVPTSCRGEVRAHRLLEDGPAAPSKVEHTLAEPLRSTLLGVYSGK